MVLTSFATASLLAVSIVFPESSCDRWLRGFYGQMPYADYELVERAARTLEANSNGKGLENSYSKAPFAWAPLRGIMPSPAHFVGVWNWDSAFHMMGVSRWDADYARDQIRIFTDVLQQPDGMYADCVREGKDPIVHLQIGTHPAVGFRTVTDCSKPPVFAWGAWLCDRRAPFDKGFLRKVYDSLARSEKWWRTKRFNETYGLFHYDGNCADPSERKIAAGWESGMDDSPRWDGCAWNYLAVDLNCYMALTYRVLAQFATRLGEADAAAEFAEKDRALEAAIEKRLWDEKDGCYYDLNLTNGEFSRILSPCSFIPLFIGMTSEARGKRMIQAHAERLSPGWPSVSYDDPKYDPMGYWRGRTWLNVAYMALKGVRLYGGTEVSDRGKAEILGWIRNDPGVIYENYNSKTGMPAGAPHFGWSSVFILAFVLDWDLPREEILPCLPYRVAPIVATEQETGSIQIIEDGKVTWSCRPWEDSRLADVGKGIFKLPDEAKPQDGGKSILFVASQSFGEIDVATRRVKWYGKTDGCPHSIERLPDGRFAVACSWGMKVVLVDVAGAPLDPEKQRQEAFKLEHAHGVAWDAARECLWAVGEKELVAFDYRPEAFELVRRATYPFPEYDGKREPECGHDLQMLEDGRVLFTGGDVFVFDPEKKTFDRRTKGLDVKCWSVNGDGEEVLCVPRERWWTDRLILKREGREHVYGPFPGTKFYKARWFR